MIPFSRFQNYFRFFSTASSLAPEIDGQRSYAAADARDPAVNCVAYKHSMFRPPAKIRLRGRRSFWNSCSLIGSIVASVSRYSRGVYTFLEISARPSPCRILLSMNDDLAEISLKYLKPNDFVYVRGALGSYEKATECGKRKIFQKIFVEELNYVRKATQCQTQKPEEEYENSVSDDNDEPCRDRLRLWQQLFANPYEWWDNRKKSWGPSFRHKDTREGLWIRPDDPPG